MSSLVQAQSTFVRAIDLYSFGAQTALHPASGGYIHVAPGLNATVARLDSMGQPVSSVAVNLPGQVNLPVSGLERMADGAYVASFSSDYVGRLLMLDTAGMPITCKPLPIGTTVFGLAASPDGGFYAVGQIVYFVGTSQHLDGWVGKFDAQGDTVWTRTYTHSSTYIIPNDLVVLPSGDLVVASTLDRTLTLCRVTASGQLLWTKYYPSLFGANCYEPHLSCNQDGQLLVGCALDGAIDYAGVAAMDTFGNLQWSRAVDGLYQLVLRKCELTATGDLVLVGRCEDAFLPPQYTPFAMCISKTGNFVWGHFHRTGGNGIINDIELLLDGGYLMSANSGFSILLKTTPTDSLLSGCQPTGFSLNPVTDPFDTASTFVGILEGHLPPLVNQAFSTTPINLAYSDHCATIGVGHGVTGMRATVLPQPMHSAARILLPEGSLTDDAQLHITDLSGRSIALPVTRLADGWEIQRGGLPAGIYAYQVLQGGQRIASGKFWIAD